VTESDVYIWCGHNGSLGEQEAARRIAEILANDYNLKGGRNVIIVTEGSEPEEFWVALGGKAEYPSQAPGEAAPKAPRLFQILGYNGKLEEICDFVQSDLDDNDVFILDSYTEVYVWIGSGSTEEEKRKGLDIAQKFVTGHPDGRGEVPIVRVVSGCEPSLFTSFFVDWDTNYFKSRIFEDPYEKKLREMKLAKEGVVTADVPPPTPAPKPVTLKTANIFTYEELKQGIPEGVDPTRKEDYISEEEFFGLFGMKRNQFKSLPKWKQNNQKRNLCLF